MKDDVAAFETASALNMQRRIPESPEQHGVRTGTKGDTRGKQQGFPFISPPTHPIFQPHILFSISYMQCLRPYISKDTERLHPCGEGIHSVAG